MSYLKSLDEFNPTVQGMTFCQFSTSVMISHKMSYVIDISYTFITFCDREKEIRHYVMMIISCSRKPIKKGKLPFLRFF